MCGAACGAGDEGISSKPIKILLTILRSSAILYPKQQSFDDLTRQTAAADITEAVENKRQAMIRRSICPADAKRESGRCELS